MIDLSQIEVLTTFMAGALVQAQVTGEDPPRRDALRPGLCPHGLFPCAEPGQHVAIAVRDDEDWARLCVAIERPDLAADASLASVAGREASRACVDDAVAAWTRDHDGLSAEAALQEAGVPAVPAALAARAGELAMDEHLWARGFYRILDRAHVGAHPYPGPLVGLHATPAVVERPAPLYGEHTAEVLRELLGLGDDEIAALHDIGVTSSVPRAQDWR